MHNAVGERNFDIREVSTIIRRNLVDIFIAVALCVEIALLLILYLPPKYKTAAVLDIHSSYFKNPLVNDLISEITDPGELRSQREALVRLALNPEFIDDVGERFNLFRTHPDSRERLAEKEALLKRIEYHSLGATSFQLSAIADTAGQAKSIADALLEQVKATVMGARYDALQQARDAIQTQVQFLARTLNDLGKYREAEKLQTRLAELNNNIAALKQRFTDAHPRVVELKREVGTLQGELGQKPQEASIFDESESARAFLHSSSEKPTQEIYNDLLRKLSYLNVLLTMEGQGESETPIYLSVLEKPVEPLSPFFPDPAQFLLFGLAAGLLAGMATTVIFELRRAEDIVPEEVVARLQIPHLGMLPRFPEREELLLLEASIGKNLLSAPQPEDRE